jgi:hypothetical protein
MRLKTLSYGWRLSLFTLACFVAAGLFFAALFWFVMAE